MIALRSILICLIADGIVALGDFWAKKWSVGLGAKYFWGAWALYVAVSGLWFVLLKNVGDLGRSSVVWAATGVAAALIIGALMGERPSPLNWVGISMAVIGVVLTSL
jgi:drug/metabolite transporter (DMT)-like permease